LSSSNTCVVLVVVERYRYFSFIGVSKLESGLYEEPIILNGTLKSVIIARSIRKETTRYICELVSNTAQGGMECNLT
jgi:hypothetical protein